MLGGRRSAELSGRALGSERLTLQRGASYRRHRAPRALALCTAPLGQTSHTGWPLEVSQSALPQTYQLASLRRSRA